MSYDKKRCETHTYSGASCSKLTHCRNWLAHGRAGDFLEHNFGGNVFFEQSYAWLRVNPRYLVRFRTLRTLLDHNSGNGYVIAARTYAAHVQQ